MTATARSSSARREAAEARRARRASLTDTDEVMAAAAAFLSVRPRSVAETRGRLRHLGYPGALVDAVVERLVGLTYLDDRVFARWWVESRDRARPRGVMALRRELQLKGISRDIADEALTERAVGAAERAQRPSGLAAGAGPPDEDAWTDAADADAGTGAGGEETADLTAARRLLARREAALQREADPRRRRQKAYALLARHGFTPDLCRMVAAGVVAGDQLLDEDH